MQIEKTSLIAENLIFTKLKIVEADLYKGFVELKNIEYRENIFSGGPIIFILSDDDKEDNLREVTYCVSVNQQPDDNNVEFKRALNIDNMLLFRQADQEPSLMEVKNKLQKVAKNDFGKDIGKLSYCVCWDIYGEQTIDLYVQML